MTPDELQTLFFKLEFNLPIAQPELDALRGLLHLSEPAAELLAQFQPQTSN